MGGGRGFGILATQPGCNTTQDTHPPTQPHTACRLFPDELVRLCFRAVCTPGPTPIVSPIGISKDMEGARP